MTKIKTICLLLLFVGVSIGGLLFATDVNAYFNPQEKKSTKGNWMQCYALQYEKGSAYGTATGGDFESPTVALVASTQKLCAYVNGDGKLLTGNIKLYSAPSGTGSLPEASGKFTDTIYDIAGKIVGEETEQRDYRKVYLEVKDNKVSLHQCTTNDADADCVSEVAKTWTVSKGDNFEKLAKKINDTANQKYAGYEKMEYNDNGDIGSKTQEYSQNIDYSSGSNSGAGTGDSICYDESGKLGWIFCPLIGGIGGALSDLYNSVVEPFLAIEPELLTGNGTYTAWDIFRNFANIAFVILFLAVIFSQLTGYGIDNYGIKRMLPKLIIAAVLINLSYVICQLAVDLSNILGNSLEMLFSNIAGQVKAEAGSPAEYFNGLRGAVMSFIGLGGAGAYLGVTIVPLATLGFAAIIPILLALLSAVISILFMFVILFVRKAIVILLVVVAPVAFVAYIMPNTKRMFYDKWFNIFKGTLTIYPLAGALVGGGVLASAIIVSAATSQAASEGASLGSFFLFAGALLLQVVPFFFLPTIFRRSLSAVGNLGEKISNRGRQFSQRTRGAVENSERVKEWSQFHQDRAMEGRARRIRDRLGDGRNLSERQRMALARASNRVAGYESRREEMYGNILARETDRGKIENTLNSSLKKTDAEQASAALKELIARGGVNEALMAMDGADWDGMDENVRNRVLQTMASSNVDAFQSYAKYRNTGGKGSFSSWYNGTNADRGDTKIKDSTYAAHLKERGVHAMDGLSKDEMQFMTDAKRGAAFAASMGADYNATMASAMINSGDNRVRSMAGDVISSGIEGGSMNVEDLKLTANDLASMGDDATDKLLGAYEAKWANAHPGWTADQQKAAARKDIQTQLKAQIDAAKSDPRTLSRMSGKMRDLIGP